MKKAAGWLEARFGRRRVLAHIPPFCERALRVRVDKGDWPRALPFIQSVFSNLFQDLDRARDEGFRLVVVDTPPAVTRAISEVVGFADLVVAPTRPSPHDMRAVGPTVDIVEARGKQLVFVVNAATPRASTMSKSAAL